jgi:predicted DNA-binding transcriptional regulator AlpA
MSDRRHLPRLYGAQEIEKLTGWSRQHTAYVVGRKGFPDHAYELGGRRIWLADEVEAWIRENRPGLIGDAPEEA